MVTLFDLHVHTTAGSSDSQLSPEDMVREARRLGLRGLCITEHSGPWDPSELQEFARSHDLVLIRGMEVETDMGHVLALGLNEYVGGVNHIQELSRVAKEDAGFLIIAHPFRNLYNSPPLNRPLIYGQDGPLPATVEEALPATVEEALPHPVFKLVDAIEAANGSTAERENLLALQVAQRLGLSVTGGSDAHWVEGLGRCATAFEGEITSEAQFLEALRSGAFYPVYDLRSGQIKRFSLKEG